MHAQLMDNTLMCCRMCRAVGRGVHAVTGNLNNFLAGRFVAVRDTSLPLFTLMTHRLRWRICR